MNSFQCLCFPPSKCYFSDWNSKTVIISKPITVKNQNWPSRKEECVESLKYSYPPQLKYLKLIDNLGCSEVHFVRTPSANLVKMFRGLDQSTLSFYSIIVIGMHSLGSGLLDTTMCVICETKLLQYIIFVPTLEVISYPSISTLGQFPILNTYLCISSLAGIHTLCIQTRYLY